MAQAASRFRIPCYNEAEMGAGLSRIGGQIGQGIARGEPMAFVQAALVVLALFVAYKLMVYWRTS